MKIKSTLLSVIFSTVLAQSAFAAGDYAALAEAVSQLIENSNQQSKDMEELRGKLGTLDEFNKKREQDKKLLGRMDSDVTKLLIMQSQIERLGNDNKMQGDDINKLIRDMHDAQVKVQNLEATQGNDAARRLADKAARIDKQSFDLQGIVIKRNIDQTGDVGVDHNAPAPSQIQVPSKSLIPQKKQDQLEIDILKQ